MADAQAPLARRPVLLGVSLKLYLDVAATAAWAEGVADVARRHPSILDGTVELFVLPSLPALPAVQAAIAGTAVTVGAQDLHWQDRGAFTGAVSGADLAATGCELVEIGHAERRRIFGEDDDVVRRKVAAAVRNGLIPVLCVGERDQVDPSTAAAQCVAHLDAVLSGVDVTGELIVAYEPEWAIGAASPATPEHVRAVVAALRAHLAERGAARARVIYGGSAQPGTLTALAGAVDGLFLGRFAHDTAALESIVDEAALV